MARDKIDELYDALHADGIVQKDREYFRSRMLARGAEGYNNRKKLYDALYADGIVQSKTYEDFAGKLGLHATTQPAAPVQETRTANAQRTGDHMGAIGGKGWLVNQARQAQRKRIANNPLLNPTIPENKPKEYLVGDAAEILADARVDANKAKAVSQKGPHTAEYNGPYKPGQSPEELEQQELDNLSEKEKIDRLYNDIVLKQEEFNDKMEQAHEQSEYNRMYTAEQMKHMGGKDTSLMRYDVNLPSGVYKGEMEVNPATGKLEQTYYTAEGKTFSLTEAAIKQRAYNEANDEGLQKKRLHEQNAKDIAEIDQAIENRHQELAKMYGDTERTITNPMDGTPISMHDSWASNDTEMMMLRAAKQAHENADAMMVEARHNKYGKAWGEQSFAAGAARGFAKAAFDPSTWDFGFTDMKTSAAFLNALNKADQGKPLSKAEQMLLDAKAKEMVVNAFFSSDIGRGYKAGQVTGESLPFLLEMAINPASGIGKGATKQMIRYAFKKWGGKGIKYQAAKWGTRLVGDLAGAAVMNATTGSMQTAANTMERMSGDVQFTKDKDGNYKYNGHTQGDDFGTAFTKAFASNTFERYSEFMGEYFAPLLAPLTKGLAKGASKTFKWVGLDGMANFFAHSGTSEWAKGVNQFFKKTQWHGPVGEYFEEVANNMMLTMIGDKNWGTGKDGVFNLDDNIDTFLGVALMGGVFSTVRTIGYKGAAADALARTERADRYALGVFGNEEQWNTYRNTIAMGSDEDVKALLSGVMQDKNLSNEQKRAVANYAALMQQYKGAKFGESKHASENPEDAQNGVNEAYQQGWSLTNATEMHHAQLLLDEREKELEYLVGKERMEEFRSDPIAARQIAFSEVEFPENERQIIVDYVNAYTTVQAMNDRTGNDVANMQAKSDAEIAGRTNTNGTIQSATLKVGDRKVYVMDGEVVMTDDGKAVDTEKTTKNLIVKDAETGKVEYISSNDLAHADAPVSATQQSQEARDAIAQQVTAERDQMQQGKLPFNVGDEVEIPSNNTENGIIYGRVTRDNGDGTVMVTTNNGIDEAPVSKEVLQQFADNILAQRIAKEEQERKANEAIAQEQQQADAMNAEVAQPTDPFAPGAVHNVNYGGNDATIEIVGDRGDGIVDVKLDGHEMPMPKAMIENMLGIAPTIQEQQAPVQEPAATQAPEVEPMPMNNGNPDFMAVTPERTASWLARESGLDAEEAGAFIGNMAEKAKKALDKAKKNKPTLGTDIAKYQKEKAEYEGKLKKAKDEVDYWDSMQELYNNERNAYESEIQQRANDIAQQQQEQARKAIGQTQQEQKQDGQEQQDNGQPEKEPARFILNEFSDVIGEEGHALLDEIAHQTGRSIRFADPATIARDKGKTIEEAQGLPGYFDTQTNEIVLNTHFVGGGVQKTDAVMWTLGHELTHVIRNDRTEDGKRMWNSFVDAVTKAMGEKEFEDAYNEAEARYEGLYDYSKMSADEKRNMLVEEIVADWAGRNMARSGQAMQTILDHARVAGADTKTIIEKVLDYIRAVLEALEKIAQSVGLSENDMLKKQYAEAAKQMWEGIYQTHVATEKEAQTIVGGGMDLGNGQTQGEKYSISALGEGVGFEAIEKDANGNVAFRTADGRVFNGNNPVTVDDLKEPNSVMSYMIADALALGTIKEDHVDGLLQKYADMINAALFKGLKENGGIENLSSNWQWMADTIFKTVAENSDKQYSYSLDITRVCKKNEAVINAISEMQRQLGYGISPGQVMDIYLATYESGFQVPCPVCYVFSRYIRNGRYATIAVNGQRKYGDKLRNPKKMTAEEKREAIAYWVSEYEKCEAFNEAHELEIKKAKEDITLALDKIDLLGRNIMLGVYDAEKEKAAREEIDRLDKKYKAALNVVAQSGLTSWIKQFAIHKVKGKWVLWDDTYQGFPEEYALDLRLTGDVMRMYPAIQRLRKSGGAAAGKEINFAANNDLGEVAMMLGTKLQENYYKKAVKARTPETRKKWLDKARKRFADAHRYAQQQSLRGGQRMWSWSDNIERLSPDVFVNLMQLQLLGGALQSYSKQLEGINLVANMGGYVNGSLMGYGEGYQAVTEDMVYEKDGRKYLKEPIMGYDANRIEDGRDPNVVYAEAGSPVYVGPNGNMAVLLFDDIVGVQAYGEEVTDKETGKTKHMKGLFELNKELDKAGNILVGMSDMHILTALADDRIFFVIPWHSSGGSDHILRQMLTYLGIDASKDAFKPKDYTDVQEEKDAKNNATPELVELWERFKNEKDWACGIEGGIESGNNGTLSESQMHYRTLRDYIFKGVQVFDRTKKGVIKVDKKGKPKMKTISFAEAVRSQFKETTKEEAEQFGIDGELSPVMVNGEFIDVEKANAEIMDDAFLSQVLRKVGETVTVEMMTTSDAKSVYPYEYWDESSTYDTADVNGKRYIEYCRRLGRKPKFSGNLGSNTEEDFGNFVDAKGYWKVLIDRRMYGIDNKFQDLTPVNTEGFNTAMVDPERTKEEFIVTKVADDKETASVVARAREIEANRPGGESFVDYSLDLEKALEKYNEIGAAPKVKFASQEREELDAGYTDAVKRGDILEIENLVRDAAAEAMPNTKVVDADGKPMMVYHGSPEKDIKTFDLSRVGRHTHAYNDAAIWFSNSENAANNFAYEFKEGSTPVTVRRGKKGRTYPMYINMENPFDMREIATNKELQDVLKQAQNGLLISFDSILDDIANGNHQYIKIFLDYDKLKEIGYDGVIAKMDMKENGPVEYGVFSSEQAKSAELVTRDDAGNIIPLAERFNGQKEDTRYASQEREPAPIFVSNAQRAVEGIKQNKATGDQWLAMLQKAGGLKAEEDKWMGLSDYLKGKKSVTKEELLQFIAENDVQIEEVNYAQSDGMDRMSKTYGPEFAKKFNEAFFVEENFPWVNNKESAAELYDSVHTDKINMDALNNEDSDEYQDEENKLVNWAYDLLYDSGQRAINPHRMNYVTDGLANYSEIALVVPTIQSYRGSLPEIHFTDEYTKGKAVAWIRFGDAEDSNGNKVLVIDEIQSQRHQDGRETGYDTNYHNALKKHGDYNKMMKEKYADKEGVASGDVAWSEYATEEENFEFGRLWGQVIASDDKRKVPDAPWQKTWHELCMKRMLRYAAENGYDKIAWTTGQQQADRYNLAHVIDSIDYKDDDVTGDYYVIPYDQEGEPVEGVEGAYSKEELAETFGKEMADYIVENAHDDYESIDLNEEKRFGGEGMEGFYDQMLPRFMDKYGKKWGVKTKDVELDLPNEADRVMHSVDVTDAMKESVMQGQTKFAAHAREELAEAEKNLAEFSKGNSKSASIKDNDTSRFAAGHERTEMPSTKFAISKRTEKEIDRLLGKNENMDDKTIQSFKTYVEHETPVAQMAMAKWMGLGTVRLPEDKPLVDAALKECKKNGEDPMRYKNPGEIVKGALVQNDEDDQRELLSPDAYPDVLTNKVDYGNGIVVYDVEDSRDGQQAVRDLMNDHLTVDGQHYNCWCLLYASESTGKLTKGSYNYWRNYDGTQKKVAFYNGKIVAFCASEYEDPEWWDLSDSSHGEYIPVESDIENDEYNRRAMQEFDPEEGEFVGISGNMYTGNKKNGLYREWNEDGQMVLSCNYKGGKLDGLFETWHYNGQLSARENYRKGEKDGLCETWHYNGQIYERINYKNGSLHGSFETWNKDGQKLEQAYYKFGGREGEYLAWHSNGQLRRRENYRANQPDGVQEQWYENGQMYRRENYDFGRYTGLQEEWHENGQIKTRGTAKNYKLDGLHESWYEDGQPKFRKNYKEGKLDGLQEEWYENGQPSSKGYYKDGHREGVYERWYGDGQLYSRENWKSGELDGLQEEWYEDGQMRERRNYKDGEQDGLEEVWYNNGQMRERRNYKDGKHHGMHEFWTRDGVLIRRENFKDGYADGLEETWHENGAQKARAIRKNDAYEGLVEEWNEDGIQKFRGTFKDGQPEGVHSSWYNTGQQSDYTTYKNGLRDGIQKTWYYNGRLADVTMYENGMPVRDKQIPIDPNDHGEPAPKITKFAKHSREELNGTSQNAENSVQIGNNYVPLQERDMEFVRAQVSSMPESTAWPADFPDVLTHTTLAKLKSYDEYEDAKAGDEIAAMNLVVKAIKPAKVLQIAQTYPDAVVVYPHAEESVGRNKIPLAYAMVLHSAGMEVSHEIVSANRPRHTGSGDAARLLRRARFAGKVESGRQYVIVDDQISSGSTLRDLRDYIVSQGGDVVFVSTLTSSYGATKIAQAESTKQLLAQSGITNEQLQEYGIATTTEALTNAEARRFARLANGRRDGDSATGRKEGSRTDSQSSSVQATEGNVREDESRVTPTEQVNKGIYIDISEQDFIEQILNGDKDIETRFEGKNGKGSLDSLIGQRVALITSGKGKQKVMGYVDIVGKKVYENEEEFRADANRHKVEGGTYDITNGDGKKKIGYILENPVREENPYETEGNSGHTIRNAHVDKNGITRFARFTREELDNAEKEIQAKIKLREIVGIPRADNNTHQSRYASGTTEDGESWTIRVADHPANWANFVANEEDSDYVLSIIVDNNFDARHQERLGSERMDDPDHGRYQQVVTSQDVAENEEWFKREIDKFKRTGIEPMLSDTVYAVHEREELPEENRKYMPKMGIEEAVVQGLIDLAERNEQAQNAKQEVIFNNRRDVAEATSGVLGKLRKAMAAQRKYDKATVDGVIAMARLFIDNHMLEDAGHNEVVSLLKTISMSTGRENLEIAARRLIRIMLKHQARTAKNLVGKALKVRASKINNAGVKVKGKLDPRGQEFMEQLKDAMEMDLPAIDELISKVRDAMGSEKESVAERAAVQYQALLVARKYVEEVKEMKNEEEAIRRDMEQAKQDVKDGNMSQAACTEFLRNCEDLINENLMRRANSAYDVVNMITDTQRTSIDAANAWAEREQQRAANIQHMSNSDTQGRPYEEHKKDDVVSRMSNNAVVRFFAKPLANFVMMMRMIGSKSVDGAGYLYNYFVRGWVDATQREWENWREAEKELDAKVREVCGRRFKHWSDLYGITRKSGATLKFWDGGKMKEHELTQGNMMYVYMVAKMKDGMMKLNRMGLTQADIDAMADALNPTLKTLADWVQEDFLPNRRELYNDVYKRMFGANMDAIENYFPLKILKTDMHKQEDVNNQVGSDELPSEITENIIKRKHNTTALDILGTDAASLVIEHVQKMEHWRAFAELIRDINTLLSYKKFKNTILNMRSAQYGAGENLWQNFKDCCAIAMGAYKPKLDKESLDRHLNNWGKMVTAAKVSCLLYTAIKQLTSFPAYFSASNWAFLALTSNPVGAVISWRWAMKNLPTFEKRWKSRMAGNYMLEDLDSNYAWQKKKFVKGLARVGMTPNAFVDALTVSMGGYAIFLTKYNNYRALGYDKETARKRALQDAAISVNETQQSSEGAFMSPMQAARSYISGATSLFRNSPFGYQRQVMDAMRNMKHFLAIKNVKERYEFMVKQLVRDGISEDRAKAWVAGRTAYTPVREGLRLVIFGWTLQFLWNLCPNLIYLLAGDDDDEKQAIIDEAAEHALWGPIEGLTMGNLVSELGNAKVQGEKGKEADFSLLPMLGDIAKIYKEMDYDEVKAYNDIFNLCVQMGIGVNPQSIESTGIAIMDACYGQPKTASEAVFLIARILNMPQQGQDKLWIDEVSMTLADAKKLPVEEIARRYAECKVRRGATATEWLYTVDEKEQAIIKQVNQFEKMAKERWKKSGYKDLDEAYQKLAEDMKPLEQKLARINYYKRAQNFDEYDKRMNEFANTKDYESLMAYQGIKRDINNLDEMAMRAKTLKESRELKAESTKLKKYLFEYLQSINSGQQASQEAMTAIFGDEPEQETPEPEVIYVEPEETPDNYED